MDESITIRISGGDSTSLTTTCSPVINVNGNSEIALVWLKTSDIGYTNNSTKICIYNKNHRLMLHIEDRIEVVIIPFGFYTIHELNNYISEQVHKFNADAYFSLTYVDGRNRINSNYDIMFDDEDSVGSTLGFEKKVYNRLLSKDLYHQSENILYRSDITPIKVLCNIAKGSFDNGQQSHSIYEFFPREKSGVKIVESPNNLIYYKLRTAVIKKIKVDLVDEENNPIYHGKTTVILNIRPIKY